MRKGTKGPRFTLTGTPSAPRNQGITLEPVQVESEIVCIEPGIMPGYAQLTAYRADGRPFIRVDLPEEAVPAWAAYMECYTQTHDETRPTRPCLGVVRGGLVS